MVDEAHHGAVDHLEEEVVSILDKGDPEPLDIEAEGVEAARVANRVAAVEQPVVVSIVPGAALEQVVATESGEEIGAAVADDRVVETRAENVLDAAEVVAADRGAADRGPRRKVHSDRLEGVEEADDLIGGAADHRVVARPALVEEELARKPTAAVERVAGLRAVETLDLGENVDLRADRHRSRVADADNEGRGVRPVEIDNGI